ncbi:uncharacterized protein mRpL35 [Macrobrachium rosenbergii]|uniref:uncharacterized protein mRpL35 n=1 Tax=Macrobrachium rosenbergii TaxID=79674 RepID=UPI0034D43EDF
MFFLSQMFLRMITKFTSPKSLLPFSKVVIRPTKTLAVSPGQFSSAALPLSRQLHSCCLLRHGAHERPILAAVTRFPELSPKLQPFCNAESPSSNLIQKRSVTKWSLSKGKRKTVKTVIRRFKRLDWPGRGIWIRPRAGANKRIWKKNRKRRYRAKTHVFCNATQSHMLDKMVTRFWKRPRYYPDDPYRPFMQRESFPHTSPYPREYF